jgi:hypothetical protein
MSTKVIKKSEKSSASPSPLPQPNPLLTAGLGGYFGSFPPSLSLDKVVFIWDIPAYLSGRKKNLKFYQMLRKVMFSCQREYDKGIYEFSVKINDVFCSWGRTEHDPKGSTFRMEFNPNNVVWDAISPILKVLKFGCPMNSLVLGRITRMDIAIDYRIDLNPLAFHDDKKKKSHGYWGYNGWQTIYFGSSSSDVQIRIYDKALEQKESFDIGVDSSWWRVEAQDRRAHNILSERKNPFETLRVLKFGNEILLPVNDYKVLLFQSYAEKHGFDNALKIMPKETRRIFKKKYIVDADSFELPKETFERSYKTAFLNLTSSLDAYSR